jgi:hypothetical protein
MTQPRRRLRRRSTNNDTDTTDSLTRSPTQLTVPLEEIEQNPHHTSEPPPINLPNSTIAKLDLDLILMELRDDSHHEDLSESDYWDESHNWSDNSASDEYWHFLGHYE